MIALAATYVIHPEHLERALGHFAAVGPPSRNETGCRTYLVHRSKEQPNRFFLYEQYDDEAALAAHRASPHFTEHVKNGLWTIMESREAHAYEPLTAANG